MPTREVQMFKLAPNHPIFFSAICISGKTVISFIQISARKFWCWFMNFSFAKKFPHTNPHLVDTTKTHYL